jgi:hypothetical protein
MSCSSYPAWVITSWCEFNVKVYQLSFLHGLQINFDEF